MQQPMWSRSAELGGRLPVQDRHAVPLASSRSVPDVTLRLIPPCKRLLQKELGRHASLGFAQPAPTLTMSTSGRSADFKTQDRVVDHDAPHVTEDIGTHATVGRTGMRGGDGDRIITVQPLKRAEMQPSYAQDMGLGDVKHGLYGSLLNALGVVIGCLGAIPCCPCAISSQAGCWRLTVNQVPEPLPEYRPGLCWSCFSIRPVLQGVFCRVQYRSSAHTTPFRRSIPVSSKSTSAPRHSNVSTSRSRLRALGGRLSSLVRSSLASAGTGADLFLLGDNVNVDM